jgi:hypothetical protein
MKLYSSQDESHRPYTYNMLLWLILFTVFASRRRKWVSFVILEYISHLQNKIFKVLSWKKTTFILGYFCPLNKKENLNKLFRVKYPTFGFPWYIYILINISNIKFKANPPSGSWVDTCGQTGRRTDRHDLADRRF